MASYLANLSPPEDSVGHDLGLVVLPWGGHCIAARVQGIRRGARVSVSGREGATPRQTSELCGSWDEEKVGV